jgi:hypothetical protein
MTPTISPERQAARFKRRSDRLISEISGTGRRLSGAIQKAQRKMKRIAADDRLSESAKAEDRRAVEEDLRATIDEIEVSRTEAGKRLDELAREWTAPADVDSSAGLLDEQRLSRAWQRTQRLLEAGEDPVQLARNAVDAGDRATVEALRAELSGYMQANGGGAYASATLKEVEQAAAPLRTPVEEAAHEVRESARQALYKAEMATSVARADGAAAAVDLDGLVPAE